MNTGSRPLIRVQEITKAYPRRGGEIVVLEDFSLEVAAGEFLAIMAPSGSGKSTLLNLIGGVDRATRGEVWVGDAPLHRLSEAALTRWRAEHVGFVFQLYHLLPILTVLKNVELPLIGSGIGLGRGERRRKVAAALTLAGLDERFWGFKPMELSGGQQQRVGIARALVTDPDLLLCDEPTGDLDQAAGDAIMALLQDLNRRYAKTIVLVTHDPHAAEFAARTVHLDKHLPLAAASA